VEGLDKVFVPLTLEGECGKEREEGEGVLTGHPGAKKKGVLY
jgi:hypothetical protein